MLHVNVNVHGQSDRALNFILYRRNHGFYQSYITLLSSENVIDSDKVFISEVISFVYIVKGKGHKIDPVRNKCLTVP